MKKIYSGIVQETIQTSNEINDLRMLINFFDFLFCLEINEEASIIAEEIEDMMAQEFCPDCECIIDDCNCNRGYTNQDPDAAYDRWKDD